MAVTTPTFLQTKKYAAKAVRAALLDLPIQNGVVGAGDLAVTQDTGSNMNVKVAAGACWIAGTTSARQGMYDAYNDASVTLAVTANGSGNPRIDQVIARIYDTTDGGAGSDVFALEVLTGTATAGAQAATPGAANYRSGAAALPASSIRLADITVASGASAITNANIQDRRPWARGFLSIKAGGGATSSTTNTWLDANTNLQNTMECSGVPIRVTLTVGMNANTGSQFQFRVVEDGTPLGSPTLLIAPIISGTIAQSFTGVGVYTPSPGLHKYKIQYFFSSGSATVYAGEQCTYEELVRQNQANG